MRFHGELRAAASVAGLLAGLTFATAAAAQDAGAAGAAADTPPSETSPLSGGSNAPTQSQAADIVVTGSRIARRDFTAESPIVTAGQELIQKSGNVSLTQSLNQLPQFIGSLGDQTPATTAAGNRSGRANLNLRGLGTSRTLVLLDGRRLPPSDAQGAVDLNTVPSALLENVEVITGGASAAYGSDAIAGVVNLRLRKNFQGLQLDGQAGLTSRGDGPNQQISLLAGQEFAEGRGRAMVAGEFYNRGLITRDPSARPFFNNETSVAVVQAFVGSGNLPSAAKVSQIFARYGSAAPPNTSTFYAREDGTLFTFGVPPFNLRPGEQIGPFPIIPVVNAFGTIDQYGLQQGTRTTLSNALRRYNGFGRLEFDLSDNVTIFGQTLYTRTRSRIIASGVACGTQNCFMSPNNVFIPAAMKELLDSRPRPAENFLLATGNFNLLSPFENRVSSKSMQFSGGLSFKDFFKDWTADIYGSYGRTKSHDERDGYVDLVSLNRVLQAADGGQSLCTGGFNPFLYRPVSQSCKDYLLRTITRDTEFKQRVAEANLQGGLFKLPAGDVRFALGASYRKESYRNDPSNEYIFATVAGIRTTAASRGTYDVKEVYGELLVPILADLPLIKSLNLDLAYRLADYSSIGKAESYKIAGEWKPFSALLVRGGYQRSIRAPSLGDLFNGFETGSAVIGTPATGGGDPCDSRQPYRNGANAAQLRALCLAQGIPADVYPTFQNTVNQQPTRSSGNPNLEEEKSKSITAGAVLRPGFASPLLSKLSLSVDYYSIKLDGAIQGLAANVTLQRCFNLEGSNPTYDPKNFYCTLIQRISSNNTIEFISSPTVNLSGYKTWGIDFQADWGVNFADLGLGKNAGSFNLNAVVSYVGKYAIQNQAGEPFLDYAGTIGNVQIDEASAHPKWKSVVSGSYAVGPLTTTLRWRYIDKMRNSILVTAPTTVTKGVNSASYFDLDVNIRVAKNFEMRGGVINLLDKFPPVWTRKGVTDPFAYDLIGRRFFIGARVKF